MGVFDRCGQQTIVRNQSLIFHGRHQTSWRAVNAYLLVRDVQSAWLLLSFYAATRANCWLRTVRPNLTCSATAHDHDVLVCLSRILEVSVELFALKYHDIVALEQRRIEFAQRRPMQVACCPADSSWSRSPPSGSGGNWRSYPSTLRFWRKLAILSSHAWVGSILRRTPSENCICVRQCPHCHRRSVWFGPREGHSHRDPDFATHHVLVPVFPCVAPPPPSPCLPATAGVAVHSTTLATTSQLAWLQECWGEVGLPSRAPSPCRKGGDGCQRTCLCGTWISERSMTSMPSSGGRGRWVVTVTWGRRLKVQRWWLRCFRGVSGVFSGGVFRGGCFQGSVFLGRWGTKN